MPESPLCTMCIHISWDGQAALISSLDHARALDFFSSTSRWESSHALEHCARQALTLAGSPQIDEPTLSIPWGFDESSFSCPLMTRFIPARDYGIFCSLHTAHRAFDILKSMLPEDAYCAAFEIASDSLPGGLVAAHVEKARLHAMVRADRQAIISQMNEAKLMLTPPDPTRRL